MKQNKQTVRLTESKLRQVIKESVNKVLKESDGHLYGNFDDGTSFANSKETWINEEEFKPHGYSSISNWGGNEIQLSDTGEMARIRTVGGGEPSKPTRWLKIYFTNEGVAYVMFKGRRMRLDRFMKY